MKDRTFEDYFKLFPNRMSAIKLDWDKIDVDDFADYFCNCIKSYNTNILPIIAGGKKINER